MESAKTTVTSAREFFTPDQRKRILGAIRNAELDTSGEIRVHIEKTCPGDVLDRAAFVFGKLNIHKTELRNGVLFYLAYGNRKFAFIGDKGINAVVPEDFWDGLKMKALVHFRDGKFTEGLAEAIEATGEKLKQYFPRKQNDVNELPDEISFGENTSV
jgi:uncharacterized membrane protein